MNTKSNAAAYLASTSMLASTGVEMISSGQVFAGSFLLIVCLIVAIVGVFTAESHLQFVPQVVQAVLDELRKDEHELVVHKVDEGTTG